MSLIPSNQEVIEATIRGLEYVRRMKREHPERVYGNTRSSEFPSWHYRILEGSHTIEIEDPDHPEFILWDEYGRRMQEDMIRRLVAQRGTPHA